jgi:hypothetical protein
VKKVCRAGDMPYHKDISSEIETIVNHKTKMMSEHQSTFFGIN